MMIWGSVAGFCYQGPSRWVFSRSAVIISFTRASKLVFGVQPSFFPGLGGGCPAGCRLRLGGSSVGRWRTICWPGLAAEVGRAWVITPFFVAALPLPVDFDAQFGGGDVDEVAHGVLFCRWR